MPNILIVDDEQSYRQLLSLVFESDGNNIRTAMNGRQALAALRLMAPLTPAGKNPPLFTAAPFR